MSFRRNGRAWFRAALLAGAASQWSCGGGGDRERPPAPDPPAETPPPGVTLVNGSERVGWTQPDYQPAWSFVAYVDLQPVSLTGVTCAGAPDADCSAPLPSMSDGLHTLEIASIGAAGEGPLSEPIRLQKTSSRSVVSTLSSVAASRFLPDASFAVDVVATGLNGPVQLAAAGNGRVLAATADRRVQLLDTATSAAPALALNAASTLTPPPVGPLGVAVHPDFARNGFVFLGFIADEDGRTLLRIVRARDAGGVLGEFATLHESGIRFEPQTDRAADSSSTDHVARAVAPRLAFGPDGLLYALLPDGLSFTDAAAASRPEPALLRLRDDGRLPQEGPVVGLDVHPLGLSWAPDTHTLLGILPTSQSEATIHPIGEAPGIVTLGSTARLRLTGSGAGALSLTLDPAEAGTLALGRTFSASLERAVSGTLRLTAPVQAESLAPGLTGHIVDAVAHEGTLYVAIDDPARGAESSVVLRLTPRR